MFGERMANLFEKIKRARAELHEIHHAARQIVAIRESQDQLAAAIHGLNAQIGNGGSSATASAAPVSSATWVPPGHFYSPIVDIDELSRRRSKVFDRSQWPTGVDVREDAQRALLDRLAVHYRKLPFTAEKQDGLRYQYENGNFSYGDAIILACMLMELRPKRVLEIGSGYSSCVTMDTNELFLGGETVVSFVEPYPDLLFSLMKPGDREKYTVIATPVQDLDLTVVDQLSEGDVLFIDSTHVSKAGSDVHFEFFHIFPRLKPGVFIHIHDVPWPFEYPEAWFFDENRSWNEVYLLRAFLTGNAEYEIVFFNDFMARHHAAAFATSMPLFLKNSGGSLWLRKCQTS
jgi:Methyltransferase domain